MANTQSMIFTIYGDYIRHYGNKIWIGSLIRLLKEFGHNEQSVRVAVSRMMKQGWIDSEKKGNKSYYFLNYLHFIFYERQIKADKKAVN